LLSAHRRGYGRTWAKARLGYLQAHPTCAMCEQVGRLSLAAVVDHRRPHRLGAALESGNERAIAAARRLFWDSTNWQALCKSCHDGAKQSQDVTGVMRGADAQGVPLDAGHHWNRA
jgi:5-methylcytosine-specific restriction protein A